MGMKRDALLQAFRARKGEPIGDIATARANNDSFLRSVPVREGWSASPIDLVGESEVLRGAESTSDRTLLYLHGGGYVFGSARGYRGLVSEIAAAAGAQAITLDYRLAPEHPFPAAIDDAAFAYRILLERGQNPKRLMIAGDSAGGGLALSLGARIIAEGLPSPAAIIAISPWTDLANGGATFVAKAKDDPMLSKQGLDECAALYIAGADLAAPLASPVHAKLTGLPPILIHVGSDEVLLSDAEAMKSAAREQGVDATLEIWPGMFHVWHAFFAELEEAREAIDEIGAWMKRRWL